MTENTTAPVVEAKKEDELAIPASLDRTKKDFIQVKEDLGSEPEAEHVML